MQTSKEQEQYVNHWIRKAALMVSLPMALACGGGDNTGPDDTGFGTMSASIAGSSWSGSLAVQAVYSQNVLAFAGNGSAGSTTYQINITVSNVTTTGTFAFGVGAPFGNQALLTQVNPLATWSVSGLSGSGTLTVSSISATGAQGTFSFTGTATPNTAATGTKAVTSGQFNVKF